jgi:hypothetical protein
MTGAAPLTFPGSKPLSDWWRLLAPWRPRDLWIGHLLLHRVEAPVRLARSVHPDRFALLVLRALALEEASPPPAAADPADVLDRHLHLGRSWLHAVLGKLLADGLIGRNGDGLVRLTALGREALTAGSYADPRPERRTFYFAESSQPGRPPHFLNLTRAGVPLGPGWEHWEFDLGHLAACIDRPAEWKQRFGFPEDVRAVVGADAEPDPVPSWQRVILDRAEHLVVALVLVPVGEGGERLLAFAAQPEGWTLQADRPVLSLNAGWLEPFPELGQDPPPERWREAWLAWCQPRGLPAAEAGAVGLERRGHRLRVLAPPRLREQLESSHSDALRGRAWVVAGDGLVRATALLEIATS